MTLKQQILNRYSNEPTDVIAKELNVPIRYVYNVAYRNGIKKTKEYKDKYQPGYENLMSYGMSTRYKKGHTPHNKGKKMTDDLYAKCQMTMYKKGNKPHNTQPVGTISMRKDNCGKKYQYIKLSDSNWQLYHRFIYEQKYGPIPPGYIVRFKDNNENNCEINNLHVIPREENMNLNSMHNYPAPIKAIIRLYNKLKNKINGKKQD